MLRLSFILLLITLAAPAQERQAPASPAAKFRITGTVVQLLTGQPLARAEITIGRIDNPDVLPSVITPENGRFAFENLAPGKYWLRAQARGYSAQLFNQHEEFSTAIAVGPNLQSQDLVFRVRPEAFITGNIADEQNDPVRDAQVMLFRVGPNGSGPPQLITQAGTDDRGLYHFGHVAAGTYFIAVNARPWYAEVGPRIAGGSISFGNHDTSIDPSAQPEPQDSQFDVTYPITYYPSVTDASAATPITAKPGDRFSADISLTPVPALHLRILGLDPAQGTGAILQQYLFGTHALSIPTQINSFQKGEMEISGIPPGQFSLFMGRFGQNPSIREKQIDISQDSETDSSGTAAPPAISGLVELDGGKPLTRPAFVRLSNRASGEGFGARVSEKGEFEIANQNVRPGNYEVAVFNLPNATVRNISANGAKVVGQELEISSGASVRLTITLSQGVGRVDGTALRDGEPQAGAMVVLVPQDIEHNLTLVRRDQSDSDGTFSLYNVLPGKYQVIALANGWDLQWMNPTVLQPYLSSAETVDVTARGHYNLKVNTQ